MAYKGRTSDPFKAFSSFGAFEEFDPSTWQAYSTLTGCSCFAFGDLGRDQSKYFCPCS